MHITAFQPVPRWLLTGFTEIDSFCLQAVRSKPILIRPEHEVGQHVLRATRRLSTHVPIYEADDLEYDFSNPAFERSDKFLQYQTAAVLLQSCWRGYLLRRQLPVNRYDSENLLNNHRGTEYAVMCNETDCTSGCYNQDFIQPKLSRGISLLF